jgi:predicted nucleotidyltransferase
MLNPHHVLVRRLRPFLAWERQVLDEVISVLTHEIKRHAAWVSAAYLFGSSTRGDMTSGSDIDLAVAIPPSRVEETEKAFEGIADTIRLQFGNRLDVTIGAAPVEELRRPGRRGSSLWGEIVRDGVTLIA